MPERIATFSDFVRRVEPRLGDALIAALGPEVGHEATEEALIWAWEHWERAQNPESPVAYLFWVGWSKAKKYR